MWKRIRRASHISVRLNGVTRSPVCRLVQAQDARGNGEKLSSRARSSYAPNCCLIFNLPPFPVGHPDRVAQYKCANDNGAAFLVCAHLDASLHMQESTLHCWGTCKPCVKSVKPKGEHHFLFYSVPVVTVCLRGRLAWWKEFNRKLTCTQPWLYH